MEADIQASERADQGPIYVGIYSEEPFETSEIVPLVEELGWETRPVDPFQLAEVPDEQLDLIIFSLTQDARRGLEIVVGTRAVSRAKILVICADRNPQVIADVLRSGADDYLVSPYEPAELVARMRALVTRIWPFTERRESSGIKFDSESHTIVAGPLKVQLSPLEWEVLSVLLEHDGLPVSTDTIAKDMDRGRVQPSTVPRIISHIRRKLETSGFVAISVITVQNRGYVARFRRSSDYKLSREEMSVQMPNAGKPQTRPADRGDNVSLTGDP